MKCQPCKIGARLLFLQQKKEGERVFRDFHNNVSPIKAETEVCASHDSTFTCLMAWAHECSLGWRKACKCHGYIIKTNINYQNKQFVLLMSILQGMQQLNNKINIEYVATDQLIAGAYEWSEK